MKQHCRRDMEYLKVLHFGAQLPANTVLRATRNQEAKPNSVVRVRLRCCHASQKIIIRFSQLQGEM